MAATSALILTGIICFLAGALIAALITRTVLGNKDSDDIEAKFNTLQSEYSQYQQSVAQHFVDTSRLVSEAQQHQKELREHLVSGALHLTSSDISRSILAQADEDNPLAENAILENLDPADLSPPKDWAPKTPGQNGVLSEEFGLKEEQPEGTENIEVQTAKPATKAV